MRVLNLCATLACCASACCVSTSCAPEVIVGYADSVSDGAAPSLDASADATLDAPSDAPSDATADAPSDAASDGSSDATADAASDAMAPLPEITWLSGAHPGNDLINYLDFGDWRGRPLAFAQLFPDRAAWDGIVTPSWPVDMFDPFDGLLVLSLPLYPEGLGNNLECASGAYDDEWQRLGTFLNDHGRPDTIVRLGWGFNDLDHPWRADADPTDWIECFRRVVTAIRSTDPQIRIDWSFNSTGAPQIVDGDPYTAYPGDDYVDFVGVELFDIYPPALDEAQWDAKCNAPSGLCGVFEFAREHGKQVGIAEWAVASCDGTGTTDLSGNVGGDNAFFIRKVVETFALNADVMAFEAYFEDGNTDLCTGIGSGDRNPDAAAEYRRLFELRNAP